MTMGSGAAIPAPEPESPFWKQVPGDCTPVGANCKTNEAVSREKPGDPAIRVSAFNFGLLHRLSTSIRGAV
jgi:hypothetical protein